MYCVSSELYDEVAARLCDAIGSGAYFSGTIEFRDARFEELLLRFRARNWPETLSDEEATRWQQFCAKRLLEGEPPFLTIAQYFEEIDRLGEETDFTDEALQDRLAALYEWGERLGEACGE